MKIRDCIKFILFFLLVAGSKAFAQQTNSPINKLIIKYSKGSNSFDRLGVCSRTELFEFERLDDSVFKLIKYLKIKDIANAGNQPFMHDTSNISVEGYPLIPESKIDRLFSVVNTSKDNFNYSFIYPKLKKPSKKQILKVAKHLDLQYKIDDDDSPKQLTEKVSNFDKLNEFIKLNKPDEEMEKVIVDAWDVVQLAFFENSETLKFNLDFTNILGQPVEDIKADKQHINLEANLFISAILPARSTLKSRLQINNITQDYIKWYIAEIFK